MAEAMRQTLTDSTKASESCREAAKDVRRLAKLEALKAKGLENDIAKKEQELIDLRKQLAQAGDQNF